MNNDDDNISPDVQKIRDEFSKYWDGLKKILTDIQIELEKNDKAAAIAFLWSDGVNKVISRPLKIGEIIVRLGISLDIMKPYDLEGRPWNLPFANGEEEFWKNFFTNQINTPEDIVDITQFYIEVFDGVVNSNIKRV